MHASLDKLTSSHIGHILANCLSAQIGQMAAQPKFMAIGAAAHRPICT
jgi:hypothetical protein